MTVVVLGSANLDTVVTVHRHPHPGETVHGTGSRFDAGGKGLNQAVAAARAGANTIFVGAVGDDEAGRVLKSALAQDGVSSRLAASPTASGTAMVVVADNGENSIIVLPGANADAAGITERGQHALAQTGHGDVVLAQLEIPAAVVELLFQEARARGALTILNAAPSNNVPASLLDTVDVLIVNEHECLEITQKSTVDDGARHLAQRVGTVIVTLGNKGAIVVSHDIAESVPAFPVSAVDTTAAGDTFCGAFAAHITTTLDIAASTRFGSAAAALSVQRHGASSSAPTEPQIRSLLEGACSGNEGS